jgi:hypothetical protein
LTSVALTLYGFVFFRQLNARAAERELKEIRHEAAVLRQK